MSNVLKRSKKFLSVSLTITTIVWSVGLFSFLGVPVVAQAAAGDLVKSPASSGVYLVGNDGTSIHVFPHYNVYLSWGYPGDFSTVTTADLSQFTEGNPVAFRDGSLFRGTAASLGGNDSSAVYVVENGSLRAVVSGDVYQAVYSDTDWARVTWVPDNLLEKFAYPIGDDWTATDSVPDGTLVKSAGDETLYLVSVSDGVTSKMAFSSTAAAEANRFDVSSVLTVSDTVLAALTAGDQVTGADSTLSTPTVAAIAATPDAATSLSVSVASDSPAASTIVAGQGAADLVHFTFTNGGASEAVITSLTVTRVGVSADTTPSALYIYDGATRLTDSASISEGTATFAVSTGIITLAAGASKTLAIKSDIAASTSGQIVGMSIVSASDITTNDTGDTVSGTFPVNGALHSVATATLATNALSSATGSGNTDPGVDITLWQGTSTIAQRTVSLTRLALRQIGSIKTADIGNFRLLADGVEIASTDSLDANGYVTFATNTDLKTGARTLKVIGDVTGGSGRTVRLSLRGAYDIDVTDSSYGVGVLATGTFPFGPSAFTVNAGTTTVVKRADSPSANLVLGASDAVLGTWDVTAYGEDIKIETLTVGIDVTGATDSEVSFRSGRVMFDGVQAGSTTTIPAVNSYASGTSFTTNYTVKSGTTVTIEARADMYDNEDTDQIASAAVTALQAALVLGSANAVPAVSITGINVPSATQAANSLTISSGSLAMAKTTNYPNQTVVDPITALKIASFQLSGDSTEAINVTSFDLDVAVVGTADVTDVTDVWIKYGDSQVAVKSSVTAATNTWSPSITIAKNESIAVEVYGSLGSDFVATDTVVASLQVTGTTVASAQSADTGVIAGQTITIGTATIAVDIDASTPTSQLVDDSGTVKTGSWKFTTTNDSYTITDITVTLADTTAVSNVILKDGSTVVATQPATDLSFNDVSIAVAANTTKVIDIELQLSAVGFGAGTSAASVLTTVTAATARNSQGTSAAVTETQANPPGNVMYVYKAVPTITNVTLPTTVLNTGTQVVSKFTVGTNGTGTIAWQKLLFTVTKSISGTDTLASPTLWDSDNNEIAGSGVFTGSVEDDNDTAGAIHFVADAEQQISGSKTYELRVTIAGAPAAGDNLTVQITQPSAFAAQTAAFPINTNSAVYYADTDAGATVTANDIRLTAQDSMTVAGSTSAAFTTGEGNGLITKGFGVTTGQTIVVASDGSNDVVAVTGTHIDGGATCVMYAANGTTVVAVSEGIETVRFIECTDSTDSLIRVAPTAGDNTTAEAYSDSASKNITYTITVTTDGYAVSSTVAAGETDINLPVTGGVAAAATFVWSDVSDQSHSSNTTDWTNGLKVKNLPTSTQVLSR
ncbi:MAG: hypothetical protein HOJ15_03730 [Candidatus Jacksonbacteria bacterium]|jgi:hypothetical protein|nr:hypothetical protein [Candidatus Jacksonbacteria bacterium]MBT6034206.1 hypothetical protein [Candidatus Jacksonbacteria bacterium]MBT6301510.1 hypothetical protein [Candidatus Jacksonbacteria bacterium]MBT6757561.1 hypothetical protein [Candidatus Jacksonbacteria bacterium]MBT7008129.1 hypothetical protein [Candidatus Jacksonbacteria bacterium]